MFQIIKALLIAMSHSWALATLCKECCLCVGEYLDWCKQVRFNGALASLWTWKCKDAIMVVLVRFEEHTLVYLCDTDIVYYAKPGFEIEGVDAVVGQFVVDRVMGAEIGRLLVFDVITADGAVERYNKLQALKCGPNITKQWCGEYSALTRDFLAKLPHETDGLIGLTCIPYVYADAF